MIRSICIYDTATALHHFSRRLSGPTLSQGSVISKLLKVTDVIKRLSPLNDEDVDWEESRVRMVLDGEGSAEERAELLLKVYRSCTQYAKEWRQ